jgi:hypothetical protein
MPSSKEPSDCKYPITDLLKKQYPDLYGRPSQEDPQLSELPPETTARPQDLTDPQTPSFPVQDAQDSDAFEIPDEDEPDPEFDHDIDHGAFELNFSEFPIAHLSKRLPKGVDRHKIHYSDLIKGRDGTLVERKWTIRTSAEHGLGGPSSLDVIFELMQIWKEQGFQAPKIYIGTYYNLIKRLGLQAGGTAYQQVEKDLESIYGLEIIAENAYYDKELGRYVDKKVKPFIGWEFYKKQEIKDYMTDFGYISVNPEFFEAFRKKSLYYLPFENNYFKTLTAHEQKLALYLSKVFNPYRKRIQQTYNRNIEQLCDLLPIYGENYKRRYYLTQACKGLIRKNFILLDRYEVNDKIITFYNRQQQSLLPYLNPKTGSKSQQQIDILLEDQLKVCGDKHSSDFYSLVARVVPDDIIYECLSEAKQEGKEPRKLYTKLIRERAKKYLDVILTRNKSDSRNETAHIPEQVQS